MNDITKREWEIQNCLLGYINNSSFVVPNADEIYSIAFEGGSFDSFDPSDTNSVFKILEFSKYPPTLKIVLKSTKEFLIKLEIHALVKGETLDISSSLEVGNHIVINKIWYPLDPESIHSTYEVLKNSGIDRPGRISMGQYLSLLKSSNEQIRNEIQVENLKSPDSSPMERPFGIQADLYPYQTKGWQWLRFLKGESVGGILADEMGLGKTLQIISLISSGVRSEDCTSLIVCPTTLLENWRREIEKFASHICTIIHQGPSRTGFPNTLKEFDVVITSYDTVVRDNSLFSQIEWDLIICDEAQAIKNPATKRATSVKKLPRRTGFAVTGTPIENSLIDLWSIMDFSVPGFLGDQLSFTNTYQNLEDGPAQLELIISPLILRRRIADVAKDLPAKIIIPQVLELSESEILQYEQIREDTEKEFKSNASLVVLIRLRLFCTHPFLINDIPGRDPASHSNKYARLVELVEEIVTNGAKVIIFTSFNKMNDLLVYDLGKRFNISSSSIDGRTPSIQRQKIVDDFSAVHGAALLVLNPIAAGAGLNITAANHVIHYNLEWNPAKEDQASARVYRRGQDRPVTIHRLFYTNTVEEAIDERLTRKRSLSETAIVGVQGEEDDYIDILNAIQKSPKNCL